MKTELESFLDIWDRETAKTVRSLESIPADKYDFRPDPDGRSLGELAWHLAEGEAYGTFFVERGGMTRDERPPGMTRPRTVPELAPEFARVHREARERLRDLKNEDLDRKIQGFAGETSIRDMLWDFVLLHNVHHRGQLTLLIREAGAQPAGMFGPTREVMPLPKAKG